MVKKINTAEKTVRDADKLSKALKESTEKSLKDLMAEALSKLVKESDDLDDDTKDDATDDDIEKNDDLETSYEVEDVDANDTDDKTNDAQTDDDNKSDDEGVKDDDDLDKDNDSDDTDDEWLDMEKYKVGDNDYDFTGVDGETALKVYNKLGDDDKICVQKDGEGKYTVKDDETGAEYEIELNADDITNDEGEDDINIDDSDDDADISIDFDDDSDVDDDDNIEIELDDNDSDEDDSNDDENIDIDITDDSDEDDDELLSEEGLGYTTDYQKNVMPNLNATETANSKDTYSMDGGIPEGNEKPYGKKGDDDPFNEVVNEEEIEVGDASNIEEGAMTVSSQSVAKTTHTPTSTPRAEHARQVAKNLHAAGEYKALQESVKKIYEKAKQIQAENKQYKDCIDKIKTSLREAAVLNVTLAQVVKLLSEETTSAKEKKSIVERFNNVKTIKESKQLYDTIKNELKENKKSGVVLEKIVSTNPSQKLNETTIYKHNMNNPSLDLMKRMDSLYK